MLDTCGLSERDKSKVRSVLNKHESMFDGNIGFTTLINHSIDTGNNPPVRPMPRRVPPHLADEVNAQIDDLIAKGVLEECEGSWCLPSTW